MSIVVDRYELGPIGTNCYVVRSSRSAEEAVVIDPSGDAAELRLELARLGTRCAAILITHGHWDHLLGVAELAEGTGAPVHMADDEQARRERAERLREEIESLKGGRPPKPPSSPRELADEAAREAAEAEEDGES